MTLRSIALAAALLASAGAAPCLGGPEIKLEGSPQRRSDLDALQGKPFDAKAWDTLSAWANGEPVTAASTAGKPVLIVYFAGWYKTSHAGVKAAQDLAAKHRDKGLVVVGVHDRKDFGMAADTMKQQGATFPYAHDADGAFRTALSIDGWPDFYLIDRAGALRYADVDSASVAAAVDQVVAETQEQARDFKPGAPADGDAAASPATGKADPAAYASAKWPAHNKGRLSARSFQGKKLPGTLGASEKFLGDKPDWTGKVVVIDFWATWCPPCRMAIPKLEALQEKHKDDVVVIGISNEPEGTVKGFLNKGKHGYAQALDQKGTLNRALGVQGIPHVVVLSSDGVIRWQGNPLEEGFAERVQETVNADPGVQARKRG